jgi:predicted SAM-dependent methyltransferase
MRNEQRKREGANHFPQSQFFIYYRWITNIEDHVVFVYVMTNDAI